MDFHLEDNSRPFCAKPIFFFIFFSLFSLGCAKPDKFESILPDKNETCGGSALQTHYIVHYKSGAWDYVENSSRENFKNTYVTQKYDELDFIEYDQVIRIKSTATVLAPLSGIDNWGAAAIGADRAWKSGHYGQGVIVAVLDSGVDIHHPQLAEQIAFNSGEAGELQNNGQDDDGNGFVDDYAGYNFVSYSGDVADEVDHGTHVAGIIAASHSDQSIKLGYVQGVSPQAKILPVKFLGQNGGILSSALRGIDYAIERGAQIINASWGGPGCSLSLRQKVGEAAQRSVLVIAAAGNNGVNLDRSPEYPAAFKLPGLITVGALTPSLNKTSFSNYSENLVHIFAPGAAIVSTIPGDRYASMSGTSMAAPFVVGASALILSAEPQLSLEDLRQKILAAVETDQNLMSVTHGRLSLTYGASH